MNVAADGGGKRVANGLKKLAILGCTIAGAAWAQPANPLIGHWKGILRQAGNPDAVYEYTFNPNGTFVETMALPANQQTGLGSGIFLIRGLYRMPNDHSVELTEQERRACPNGDMSSCSSMPLEGAVSFSFHMEGADKVVADNGQVSYRVR